jgi:lipoprotein YgeR
LPGRGVIAGGCAGSKSSDSGNVYTVKRGDTLYKISRQTGTSVSDLARLNGISPPYTIEVGQRLKLNGSSKSSSAKGGTQTAKVDAFFGCTALFLAAGRAALLALAATGKVISPYSTSEGGNKGIDIAGSRGQAVYAAGAGKVVYAGNQLRGYGNLIMIKHSEEYITAYAHNDTMLVNNGQSVKIGQKIATMGSTDADGVQLHFQIRYKATAIDPLRYLPPQGSPPKC